MIRYQSNFKFYSACLIVLAALAGALTAFLGR
jgi:hypothetical protein